MSPLFLMLPEVLKVVMFLTRTNFCILRTQTSFYQGTIVKVVPRPEGIYLNYVENGRSHVMPYVVLTGNKQERLVG